MQQAFSFTNSYPDHIYWDDYYRKLNRRKSSNNDDEEGFSSFSEIMKHPPLKWAFWLSLLALLLFGGQSIRLFVLALLIGSIAARIGADE